MSREQRSTSCKRGNSVIRNYSTRTIADKHQEIHIVLDLGEFLSQCVQIEGLHLREAYVPISLQFVNLLWIHWNWLTLCYKMPPPPPLSLSPSPNKVGFRSLRAKTLCICVLRYWRGGGGGEVDFQGRVWSLFEALIPRLWKKKRQKRISADSKQLEKSQRNRCIRLSPTEPFNCLGSPLPHYDWIHYLNHLNVILLTVLWHSERS